MKKHIHENKSRDTDRGHALDFSMLWGFIPKKKSKSSSKISPQSLKDAFRLLKFIDLSVEISNWKSEAELDYDLNEFKEKSIIPTF